MLRAQQGLGGETWAALGPGLREPLKTRPTTQRSRKPLGGLAGSEEETVSTNMGRGLSQALLAAQIQGGPEEGREGDWRVA